jgi:hypothetical protein
VFHSATKYLNGHSDMIGGIAVVGENTEIADRLGFLQNAIGGIQGPFDSFLALRGLKTLALRMERHSKNAMELAGWLEKHPKVGSMRYPGLKSHAQYELAKRQMSAFGGMISIVFNTERPHEALAMKCPPEIYSASSRPYSGLPDLTYPLHDRDALVTACGQPRRLGNLVAKLAALATTRLRESHRLIPSRPCRGMYGTKACHLACQRQGWPSTTLTHGPVAARGKNPQRGLRPACRGLNFWFPPSRPFAAVAAKGSFGSRAAVPSTVAHRRSSFNYGRTLTPTKAA